MAAEIINALGAIQGLRVISRTSAVRCREKGMDIGEIGQHLNVQTVLEGTVRKSSTRLRVTAQLVNSTDGTQMWCFRDHVGFHPLFYRDEPRTVTIETVIQPRGEGLVAQCRLIGYRSLPNQNEPQQTIHFTGRVLLSRQAPKVLTGPLVTPQANSLVSSQLSAHRKGRNHSMMPNAPSSRKAA